MYALYTPNPLGYASQEKHMSSKHPQNEDKGLQAYQPHITVRAAGRLWQLSRAADLEQLWEAMTADSRDF